MKLRDYLKCKVPYVSGQILVMLLTSALLLSFFADVAPALCVLIGIVYLVGAIVPLVIEYQRKSAFYNSLVATFDALDRKNLITEMVTPPDFIEGIILYDMLKGANKAYLDEIGFYKNMQEEYREYIELWVHEIKTPIASSMLLVHNNPGPVTDSVAEDLEKIEGFVQQALFYSRSNNVHKDYLVKEINLQELCVSVIQKHSKLFIHNHVSVKMENLQLSILCDAKWVEYILSQLISNAVKYGTKTNAELRFCAVQNDNGVTLSITDNGIGIPVNELSRIFDKGFTGTNGRATEKSTGMGLYICKRLCEKLGLSIAAQSMPNTGTTISIVFPKNSLTDVI